MAAVRTGDFGIPEMFLLCFEEFIEKFHNLFAVFFVLPAADGQYAQDIRFYDRILRCGKQIEKSFLQFRRQDHPSADGEVIHGLVMKCDDLRIQAMAQELHISRKIFGII